MAETEKQGGMASPRESLDIVSVLNSRFWVLGGVAVLQHDSSVRIRISLSTWARSSAQLGTAVVKM